MILELIDYHKPLVQYQKLGRISNKLVDGQYFAGTDEKNHQILIDSHRVVGYCHYAEHEGLVVESDFKEHRCLEKNCSHFQPFTSYPYLKSHPEILVHYVKNNSELLASVQKKQEMKELATVNYIRNKEIKAQKEEDRKQHLSNIKMITEQLVAETDSYFMHIVRVEMVSPSKYKIYWVSDEDRHYHLGFIDYVTEHLKMMYPAKYIFHRIPSLYGTWATKYDYDHRNKCKLVI